MSVNSLPGTGVAGSKRIPNAALAGEGSGVGVRTGVRDGGAVAAGAMDAAGSVVAVEAATAVSRAVLDPGAAVPPHDPTMDSATRTTAAPRTDANHVGKVSTRSMFASCGDPRPLARPGAEADEQ